MFTNGNRLESMVDHALKYNQTKKCTYRQRLALTLGQKQRQRLPKWW